MSKPTEVATPPTDIEPKDDFLDIVRGDLNAVVNGTTPKPIKPAADGPPITIGERLTNRTEPVEPAPADPPEDPPAPSDPPPPVVPAPTAQTPPAAPAAPPEPAPEKKPRIDFRKKSESITREEITDVVRDAIRDNPPAPPAAPAAPPEPREDEFVESLTDEERLEVDLARFAEQHDPAKYKGWSKRWVDYLKALDTYIRKGHQDDAERTFDDSDQAFTTWKKTNQPTYQPGERRRLYQAEMTAKAGEIADQRIKKETEKLERRTRAMEVRPAIERSVGTFTTYANEVLGGMANPDSLLGEVLESIKSNGADKAAEIDPVHVPVVSSTMKHYENLTRIYIEMAKGIREFDPNDSAHVKLLDFIAGQEEEFKLKGGKARTITDRGVEKTFVTRGSWAGLTPEQRTKHWTMTDGDTIVLLAQQSAKEIQDSISASESKLTKAGYSRAKKASAASPPGKVQETGRQTGDEPAEPPSPRSTASPSIGAGQPGKVASNSVLSDAEKAALGLPGAKK